MGLLFLLSDSQLVHPSFVRITDIPHAEKLKIGLIDFLSVFKHSFVVVTKINGLRSYKKNFLLFLGKSPPLGIQKWICHVRFPPCRAGIHPACVPIVFLSKAIQTQVCRAIKAIKKMEKYKINKPQDAGCAQAGE